MQKIKTYLTVCVTFLGFLALSACAIGDEPVSVEPKAPRGGAIANNVVLMDPSTDDAMIPAVASNLSRGAVTVYTLDSPAVSSPVAPLVPGPVITVPPRSQGASRPLVSLKKPAGGGDEGGDPRVTVFDLNSPVPKAIEPAVPDTLIVPVSKTDLQSPFDKEGRLIPAPADRDLPFRKTVSEKQKSAPLDTVDEESLGADLNVVDSDEVNPPSLPHRRLPPKGMTY